MIKIKLNPEIFDDYDSNTKQSLKANSMLFIVGPSSVSFEKALVPFNCGKYAKRNQRILKEKLGASSGTTPIWATVEGMWFSEDEFPLIAASEVYPNLIMCVSSNKIKIEKADGSFYTVAELTEMSGGSSGGDFPDQTFLVANDEGT